MASLFLSQTIFSLFPGQAAVFLQANLFYQLISLLYRCLVPGAVVLLCDVLYKKEQHKEKNNDDYVHQLFTVVVKHIPYAGGTVVFSVLPEKTLKIPELMYSFQRWGRRIYLYLDLSHDT